MKKDRKGTAAEKWGRRKALYKNRKEYERAKGRDDKEVKQDSIRPGTQEGAHCGGIGRPNKMSTRLERK